MFATEYEFTFSTAKSRSMNGSGMSTESTTESPNGGDSVLKYVSSNLAVFAGSLLTLSIAFDWGFLLGIGLSPSEVPTTLQDHVRSAVIWGPYFAVLFLVLLLVQMFVIRLKKTSSESDGAIKRGVRGVAIGFLEMNDIFVVMLLALSALYELIFGRFERGAFALFITVWGLVFVWFSRHPTLGKVIASNFTNLCILGLSPFALAGAAFVGFGAGDRLLNSAKVQWEITLKIGDIEQVRQIVGVRRFSEMAILVDSAHHVDVVPASSLMLSRHLFVQPQPLTCDWFGVRCKDLNSAAASSTPAPVPASVSAQGQASAPQGTKKQP